VLTGVLFALCATLLNTGAGLLQSSAATSTRSTRPLVARPLYLLGLLLDGLGWGCTVVALRHLPVFAVQAALALSIALTALAGWALHGVRLRVVDRFAIVACVGGLGVVAGSAGGEGPSALPGTVMVILGSAAAGLGVAAIALWRLSAAWPLALVAGLGFGGTNLAVRAVHLKPGEPLDVGALATQPATYLIVVFWIIGISCYSKALSLGTLASVTAVFAVTEVIAPGLVGIALLGDPIRPGWVIPFAAGLLVAVAGVVVLANVPQPEQHRRHVR
jgi:drug/metabolite transporter (DMT)-like permease